MSTTTNRVALLEPTTSGQPAEAALATRAWRSLMVAGVACLVAACGGASSPGTGSSGDDAGSSGGDDGGITGDLQIASPASGASVSDVVDLDVQVQDPAQVEGGLTLKVDGVVVATTKALPTDPLTFDTTGFANGAHQVEVTVVDTGGQEHHTATTLTFANAPFQIDSMTPSQAFYRNGDSIDLAVSFTGDTSNLQLSADFSALDSGYSAGAETAADNGDGTFTISYGVSPFNSVADGIRSISVLATDAATGLTVRRTVDVPLRNTPPAPFAVSGAVFVDEPLPAGAVDASTQVSIVSGALQSLVSDVPSEVTLSWTSGVVVESLYLTVGGFAGYYLIPVTAGTAGQVTAEVTLPGSAATALPSGLSSQAIRSAPSARMTRSARSVRTASPAALPTCTPTSFAFDFSGAVACLDPLFASDGIGRVVLRWSGPADADLVVTEPDGEIVSYNNPISANGGALDLDANYNCEPARSSNTPTESVAWMLGHLAPGQYSVAVKLSNACNNPNGGLSLDPLAAPLPFEGTYTACDGTTKSFRGTIPAGSRPGFVSPPAVTYTLDGCDVSVHGNATYKKYLPLKRTSQMKPLSKTKVSALKSSDNSVLATTYTDANGAYVLNFKSDSTTRYYLRAEAIREPPAGAAASQVEVLNAIGARHSWRTMDLDANQSLTPNIAVVDDVLNGHRAGAFNILQILGKGFDSATALVGKPLNFNLTANWQNGVAYNCGSCFLLSANAISVGGAAVDPDEFDDPVILHEFFHAVVDHMSYFDGTATGAHQLTSRSKPNLAWAEGSATFFGCYLSGSSVYFDSSPASVTLTDLETWYDKHGTGVVGTAGNALNGNLSEGLVFGVLWDLYDGTSKSEPFDLIDNQLPNVAASIFDYMTKRLPANERKATAAGADLADFLDGYRCQYFDPDHVGFGSEDKLTTLLQHYSFPYDFPGSTICE